MTAQSDTGGMGMHKHGVSGRATRSPRFRHQQRHAVDADNRQRTRLRRGRRRLQRWSDDVKGLFE